MKSVFDYNQISQSILELNIHTKKYNKFNHIWDQQLFDLSHPYLKESMKKELIKSIKKEIISLSEAQQSPNTSSFFIDYKDSNLSASTSKQSIRSKREKAALSRLTKQFSTISTIQDNKFKDPKRSSYFDPTLKTKGVGKSNTLIASLEEIETKLKKNEKINWNEISQKKRKNWGNEEFDELCNMKNVLSLSTIEKIKVLNEKTKNMRDVLKQPFVEPQRLFFPKLKNSRGIGKSRATLNLTSIKSKKEMRKSESLSLI